MKSLRGFFSPKTMFVFWVIAGAYAFYLWIEAIHSSSNSALSIILGYSFFLAVLLYLFRDYYLKKVYEEHEDDLVEIDINSLLKIQKREAKLLVKNLFSSEEFKTAITEEIPTGKLSEDGTKNVRFIIRSLEALKSNFASSTRFFLITATVLTILFSSIVIYFGVSLLETDAVGFNKTLTKLEEDSERYFNLLSSESTTRLSTFQRVIDDNTRLVNSYLKKDSLAINLPVFNSSESIKTLLDTLIVQAVDIEGLLSDKQRTESDRSINELRQRRLKRLQEYKNQLGKDLLSFTSRESEMERFNSTLNSTLAGLQPTLKEINANIYLQEFLKRLSISLIIVSFFLAIIRFCINQYKSNYREMIKLESDSLLVRKVYLALQNTNEEETRKLIYRQLLRKNDDTLSNDKLNELDINDFMKSLLSIIEKNR